MEKSTYLKTEYDIGTNILNMDVRIWQHVNTVIKEIYDTYPDIILFTVHDSIVCSKSNYDKVKVIFDKHFKELIKNL